MALSGDGFRLLEKPSEMHIMKRNIDGGLWLQPFCQRQCAGRIEKLNLE